MKNHNSAARIGIWLDHHKAHFIEVDNHHGIIETMQSDLESHVRIEGEGSDTIRLPGNRATNNEHHKHNRKQNALTNYYKGLTGKLKQYEDIYLFGPATAKDELYNLLKSDKHFSDKTVNISSAEHLTENQMVANVRKFFNA